jgi:CheY-like chemotaxis protein
MRSKAKCCLLVEDDREDQEFFIDTLRIVSPDTGCYTASNGEEALAALANQNFTPDFIITDFNMPRMDGVELLLFLKSEERYKDIPVIFYTSECSTSQIERVKSLGALELYSKMKWNSLKDVLRKYFPRADNTFKYT